jgi:ATP/maltotriose-dependent transcriptional regulator MalT
MAEVLHNLGITAWKRGEYELARARYEESLMIAREIGAKQILLETLYPVAGLAMAQGQTGRGVQLLAAAEVLREELKTSLELADQVQYEHNVSAARAKLSGEEFASAWEVGLKMTREEAVELALKTVEEM